MQCAQHVVEAITQQGPRPTQDQLQVAPAGGVCHAAQENHQGLVCQHGLVVTPITPILQGDGPINTHPVLPELVLQSTQDAKEMGLSETELLAELKL